MAITKLLKEDWRWSLEMHDWESRRSLGGELKRFTVVAKVVLFLSIWAATAKGQFPPAPGTGPGLPETIEAIESARITTRILYLTAHPAYTTLPLLPYLPLALHAIPRLPTP